MYIENLIRPPISLPFSQVALVLGLFCTPIKQNLTQLTFKYPKVQTLHNKISLYQPILNLKKPTKALSFLFLFFFLFCGTLPLVPLPAPKTQLINYSKTKQNKTLSSQPSLVLTIPKKKKKKTFFFFLLAF